MRAGLGRGWLRLSPTWMRQGRGVQAEPGAASGAPAGWASSKESTGPEPEGVGREGQGREGGPGHSPAPPDHHPRRPLSAPAPSRPGPQSLMRGCAWATDGKVPLLLHLRHRCIKEKEGSSMAQGRAGRSTYLRGARSPSAAAGGGPGRCPGGKGAPKTSSFHSGKSPVRAARLPSTQREPEQCSRRRRQDQPQQAQAGGRADRRGGEQRRVSSIAAAAAAAAGADLH